jgi:DNA-binding helix-hairpin-helix protein with protein kinase domain
VIKLYHPGKVPSRQGEKLKVMLADPPNDPMRAKGHASIAWPEDLVISQENGEVCGFVMARLRNAYSFSKFLDAGLRKKNLPSFTYRSLCRIAVNLVSAVRALHEKGYVIGDVNDRNIMATPEALITIVDTDSFQVKESGSGHVYRCSVGTEFYTPPELQGVSFARIDRSPAHDLFGIGVLLFQLLMEGIMPFACVPADPSNPPQGTEGLIRGYFPYVFNQHGIKPPPWAPPYSMLHPTLQKLLTMCFVDGHKSPQMRPEARTWRRALKETERALVTCNTNSQHYYFNHCLQCPWCEIAQRRKAAGAQADPFPQRGSVSVSRGAGSRHSGTQRPLSTPPPHPRVSVPTTPVNVTASSVKNPVTPPMPVALNPITIELNPPMALHSAQLKLLKTMPLKQLQVPLLSPMRLKDHVPLDGYQALHDVSVELHYAPVAT